MATKTKNQTEEPTNITNPFAGQNGPFGDGPLPPTPNLGLPKDEEVVFEEDFTDVQSGFARIPAGSYPAVVVGIKKGESKGTGNPQYEWIFKITDGEFRNAEIRSWTSLVPAARWKVVEHLEACGIAASGSIVRFTSGDLVGKPVRIEVVIDEYQGKTNSKIQRVNPPDEEALLAAQSMSSTPTV